MMEQKPTLNDLLRHAARCWERAHHPERAAQRWSAAEAWSDAGRCWAKAGCHADAADAYARADDPLAEARQWLTSPWPERAYSAYQRVLDGSAPAALEVEALWGLGDIRGALQRVLLPTEGRCLEALRALARLTALRDRVDVASRIWALASDRDSDTHEEWARFAPWNRSLRWERPMARGLATVWPSTTFNAVALASIWEQETGLTGWGDRALDWSEDGTRFVATLWEQGLGWGHIAESGIRLNHLEQPERISCARFVPGDLAVLTGHKGGEVRLVHENGSSAAVEPLRMRSDVWSVAFSALGNRVAVSASLGPGAHLKTLGWHPEEQAKDFIEPQGACTPLCVWSPDGLQLAWSPGRLSAANRLVILASQRRQEIPDAHGNRIRSMSFTPDGRVLISGSGDMTIVVRDAQNGQPLAPAELFGNSVWGTSIHPQAALLAVGEGRYIHLLRVHIDDPTLLTRLSKHPMTESVMSLAFSPDGRHLLVMTRRHLHLFQVHLTP